VTHEFTAMGTTIVVGGATPAQEQAIERLFAEREQCFSPFREDSELSAVNRAAGRFVQVSPIFARTLATALRASVESHGLVDPTLGNALRAAGLGDDGEPVPDGPAGGDLPGAGAGRGMWPSVRLTGQLVLTPPRVRLDLNGVVKALAVDDALTLLTGDGFVSAGGDLATRGPLTVSLPAGGDILLRQGALATSGTTRRRWQQRGALRHHLIDSRTGAPSTAPWREVTACGARCLDADIAAKAAFLTGASGPDWLDRRGIPGRFVTEEGEIVHNQRWLAALEGTPACT
jgi:FAD:protein FMN transferase